jgi:Inositol 1,3,4-trisphosphate 5/6-kinase ATP-grasp domain
VVAKQGPNVVFCMRNRTECILMVSLTVYCAGASECDFHVVDINYFPGYEKLPGYEDLVVAFLLGVLNGESKDGYGPRTFATCSQLPEDFDC